MLSRAASSLYWLGRYVERAEFTARLVEATLRLDATTGQKSQVWSDALTVLGLEDIFAETGQPLGQETVTPFLTIDNGHSGSVMSCLDAARDNARAVRTSLSRDAWSAINRAWLLFRGASHVSNNQAALQLVEQAEIETRAFEGAIGRMLRNHSSLFMRLGAAIERSDNCVRLLFAAQHRLPSDPFETVTIAERDEWQMILQTVSAVNAYRWIYSAGLRPGDVLELLLLRRELPRSLAASAEEAVQHLNSLGKLTGFQGEADRWARHLHIGLGDTKIGSILDTDLNAFLEDCQLSTFSLDRAIVRQFRFH